MGVITQGAAGDEDALRRECASLRRRVRDGPDVRAPASKVRALHDEYVPDTLDGGSFFGSDKAKHTLDLTSVSTGGARPTGKQTGVPEKVRGWLEGVVPKSSPGTIQSEVLNARSCTYQSAQLAKPPATSRCPSTVRQVLSLREKSTTPPI